MPEAPAPNVRGKQYRHASEGGTRAAQSYHFHVVLLKSRFHEDLLETVNVPSGYDLAEVGLRRRMANWPSGRMEVGCKPVFYTVNHRGLEYKKQVYIIRVWLSQQP